MSLCIYLGDVTVISCHLIKQPRSHVDALLFMMCADHLPAHKRSMMQCDGLKINSLFEAFVHTCGAFTQGAQLGS